MLPTNPDDRIDTETDGEPTVEFEQPFWDLLALEAEANEERVEDLIKRWLWVEYQRTLQTRYQHRPNAPGLSERVNLLGEYYEQIDSERLGNPACDLVEDAIWPVHPMAERELIDV